MTYPPVLYDGATEMVGATYRAANTAADFEYPNGTRIDYLATGASTGGLFGMYRWQCPPESSGPAPHFHRRISESFYILTGVVQIYDGVRWIDAEPGDWVHVPPGAVHAFHNREGTAASMLLHFSPGAPREGYFEGLAHLHEMSADERATFYADHDNIWIDG
jgi:mannose-6-phosphate isomerase-like protein (cupin superfamily)